MNTNNKYNQNGWNEWSNKVLGDLKELKASYKELLDDITTLKIEMAIIKTKAAIFGAIGGSIFSGIIILILESFL